MERYRETRPWGTFEILDQFPVGENGDVCVKKIVVNPGERLSYQSHKYRAEHWVFVEGSGTVVINDKEHRVRAGIVITIPTGAKHRVINGSSDKLVFVEVSEGHFDENDITRYEDQYGRA